MFGAMLCECGKPLTMVHSKPIAYLFCTHCKDKERVYKEVDEVERWNILNEYFRTKHDRSECKEA